MATRTQLSQFAHKTTQGARLPGWPEINCDKLATAMGCSPMHLRGVLSGRLGTTLKFIERVAEVTGFEASEVVARIVSARDADTVRIQKAVERYQARQLGRKARLNQQNSVLISRTRPR